MSLATPPLDADDDAECATNDAALIAAVSAALEQGAAPCDALVPLIRVLRDTRAELGAERVLRGRLEAHGARLEDALTRRDGGEAKTTRARQAEARAERNRLRTDLAVLQRLTAAMVESRAALFYEKELLSLELEDLSRALFEEANAMVATEARLRAELQASNQALSARLTALMAGLETNLTQHAGRLSPSARLATRDRLASRVAAATAGSAALSPRLQLDVAHRRNSLALGELHVPHRGARAFTP